MHLSLEAVSRRIDIERWISVRGVGERGIVGNRVEGSVGVHDEIWTIIVEARVEANWLSKAMLLMRVLDGKHLKCGATA